MERPNSPPGSTPSTDNRLEARHEDAVRDRFVGSLLGGFVGDALGMPVEGLATRTIEHRYGLVRDMLDARLGRGTYTDDTEMAISVAESLVASRRFDGAHMAARFVAGLDRARGYGRGTLEALDRVAAGTPWQRAGAHTYGSGSFGNGSAMRAGPVGLLFHRDLPEAMEVARDQSTITHSHPLGRAGAAVMAAGVALAVRWGTETSHAPGADSFLGPITAGLLDREHLFDEGLAKVAHVLDQYPGLPKEASDKERVESAVCVSAVLGNDARAFNSVPAALYSFLAHPADPEQALITAVSLGGDTDTIAAMTGALCGAYCGRQAWPERWIDALERGPRGRDYVAGLADDLFLTWLELRSADPLRPERLPG